MEDWLSTFIIICSLFEWAKYEHPNKKIPAEMNVLPSGSNVRFLVWLNISHIKSFRYFCVIFTWINFSEWHYWHCWHWLSSDGSSGAPIICSPGSFPSIRPVLLPCIVSPLWFILRNSSHTSFRHLSPDKRVRTPCPPCLLEPSVSSATCVKSRGFSICSLLSAP